MCIHSDMLLACLGGRQSIYVFIAPSPVVWWWTNMESLSSDIAFSPQFYRRFDRCVILYSGGLKNLQWRYGRCTHMGACTSTDQIRRLGQWQWCNTVKLIILFTLHPSICNLLCWIFILKPGKRSPVEEVWCVDVLDVVVVLFTHL